MMKSATHSRAGDGPEQVRNHSGFFSSETVLEILKLILAGSELSEVLTVIARLVESQGNGTLCTIWLPDAESKQLYCAVAPSLPEFAASMGRTTVGPKGASCGTAVYRREPVYVADIRQDPLWDDYRDRVLAFGIRAVWLRPLFTREGKVLGTFAIHSREVRNPDALDLALIENASHIAGIAIERHMNEGALRHESDRLRLLLEITSSEVSVKLDELAVGLFFGRRLLPRDQPQIEPESLRSGKLDARKLRVRGIQNVVPFSKDYERDGQNYRSLPGNPGVSKTLGGNLFTRT
jgi:GAF domain-containing protein